MKRLKARLSGSAVWGVTTSIGIAMSWTQALGAGTPDEFVPLAVPEPGMLGLFSASVIGAIVARKFFGRK